MEEEEEDEGREGEGGNLMALMAEWLFKDRFLLLLLLLFVCNGFVTSMAAFVECETPSQAAGGGGRGRLGGRGREDVANEQAKKKKNR